MSAAAELPVSSREIPIRVARPGDPEPYAFGRSLVTPDIIAAVEGDGEITLDLLWSVGRCQEFEYFEIGGENEGSLPAVRAFSRRDRAINIVDHDVIARRLRCARWQMPFGRNAVDRRLARCAGDAERLRLYDPRTGNTTYSANAALCLARIFYDAGYTVDESALSDAANYCDETIAGTSPVQARWEIGGQIRRRLPLRQWSQVMAQYANCLVDVRGGTVYIVPDQPPSTSPIISRALTKTDIKSIRVTKDGGGRVPKRVIAAYREPDGTPKTAETQTSASPGETSRIQTPFFQEYSRARRYATEVYNKAQLDLNVELVTMDRGLIDTLTDVNSITHDAVGLSAKACRLIGYFPVDRGRWKQTYREYDPAVHSDQVFSEPTFTDTDLANPNDPPMGPVPTLTEELYTDETGTTYSRIKVEFTGTSWAYVDSYRVKVTGNQVVLEQPVTNLGYNVTHTVYTGPLTQGVVYNAEVWIRSRTGVLSDDPGEASATAQGKLLPPGDVPSLTGFEAGTLVALSWGAAEEINGDLRGYVIRRLPAADYTDGGDSNWNHTNAVTITDRVDATTYLTTAQPSGDWYYGIKAIDNTGNYRTTLRGARSRSPRTRAAATRPPSTRACWSTCARSASTVMRGMSPPTTVRHGKGWRRHSRPN